MWNAFRFVARSRVADRKHLTRDEVYAAGGAESPPVGCEFACYAMIADRDIFKPSRSFSLDPSHDAVETNFEMWKCALPLRSVPVARAAAGGCPAGDSYAPVPRRRGTAGTGDGVGPTRRR